jgi:hypothetical protein
MSVTETQIANMALHRLGVERISSLNDDNKRASLMKDLYPVIRDELLETGFWNFAMRRVELAQSGTPSFGWGYSYGLPCDFIRLYTLTSSSAKGGSRHLPEFFPTTFTQNPDFVIEDDLILTDIGTAFCVYTSRQTDTSKFSAGFVKALYLKLAAEAAYSLVQDRNLVEGLTQEAQVWLEQVRSRDAQNDNDPNDQPEFESLVLPRF